MSAMKKKAAKPAKAPKKDEPKINLDGRDTLLDSYAMGRDRVVISINRYGKKPALDLRRFYPDDEGTFQPTAKGIRIPLEVVPNVIDSLMTNLKNGALAE
jgi:hypothetical protein